MTILVSLLLASRMPAPKLFGEREGGQGQQVSCQTDEVPSPSFSRILGRLSSLAPIVRPWHPFAPERVPLQYCLEAGDDFWGVAALWPPEQLRGTLEYTVVFKASRSHPTLAGQICQVLQYQASSGLVDVRIFLEADLDMLAHNLGCQFTTFVGRRTLPHVFASGPILRGIPRSVLVRFCAVDFFFMPNIEWVEAAILADPEEQAMAQRIQQLQQEG